MLVFQRKAAVEDLTAYSAAKIIRVELDIDNGRIVAAVQYGTESGGTFTPNKNIGTRLHVLDGPRAATILASNTITQLLDAMEKRLLNLALESGVQA